MENLTSEQNHGKQEDRLAIELLDKLEEEQEL